MRKFGGSWSESKLDCVENYARSYLRVMQKQSWCTLYYVDAFAGRGKQALKSCTSSGAGLQELDSFFGDESERADTEEFLAGSAIRALRASTVESRPFEQFVLIDVDQASCHELASVIQSEFPEMCGKVKVICNDANTALDDYINTVDWTHTRALVFLDPYGLEVDWDLIIRLARTVACDVWYLFPLGGVIRMMTKDGQIQDSWRTRLNRVFGTEEWHEEFYRPSVQLTWFENEQTKLSKNASTEHVVEFIRKRLQTIFPAVSNAGILRNSKGAPLFALVLGVSSPSPKAQKAALGIANHLVKDLNQL
jgi:three-Cys-motif partner protein